MKKKGKTKQCINLTGGEYMSEHNHHHNHNTSEINGAGLIFVILLNFTITIVQIIGGLYSKSLSLISDALHNFSDGIAIIISYMAIKMYGNEKDEKRTFGYKRAIILAAFINSSILIVISLFLFKEAFVKFFYPQPINGFVVIWVSLVGLIANVLCVFLLQKGSKDDMNMRSSYLHLLGDALSSVGVLISGIAIYYFKLYWIDPLITVLIAAYVLKECLEITIEALNIFMQNVPGHINLQLVIKDIENIEDVVGVHHVHIWGLDEKNTHFEAHINVNEMLVSETKIILDKIQNLLREKHEINHITIQFEYNGCGDKKEMEI